MKKLILTFALLLSGCWFAQAQDEPRSSESQESIDDKMQQEPPRPVQRETERKAKTAAEKDLREKEIIETEKKQKTVEGINEKSKTVEKTKTVEKKSAPRN